MATEMSPQQIKNMRNVMVSMFGVVALILPDSDVIAFRDDLQRRANDLPTVDAPSPSKVKEVALIQAPLPSVPDGGFCETCGHADFEHPSTHCTVRNCACMRLINVLEG